MRRRAGASLVAGGVLGIAFHALHQIGHGPTEHNEHGVALGLTSDQWAHLGFTWAGLLAVGVWTIATAGPDGGNRRAGRLVLFALVLQWVAGFVTILFPVGQLLIATSRAWLGVDAARRRVLPVWSAVPALLVIAAWLWVPLDPEWVYDMRLGVGPWQYQYEEVLAVLSAVGWVSLGAGLAQGADADLRRRTGWKSLGVARPHRGSSAAGGQ